MQKEIILGQAGNQPFPIKRDGVSHQHARLTVEADGTILLEDLHSTNGTFVRNADGDFDRISRVRVTPDTVVRLGVGGMHSTQFWVHHALADADADFSYEFHRIRATNDLLSQQMAQELAHQKKMRFVPLAITGTFLLLTMLPILPPWLQMNLMRAGMLVGSLVSAFFIKNDKYVAIAGRKRKVITCPNCGRPLSDYELEQQQCQLCRAHS